MLRESQESDEDRLPIGEAAEFSRRLPAQTLRDMTPEDACRLSIGVVERAKRTHARTMMLLECSRRRLSEPPFSATLPAAENG